MDVAVDKVNGRVGYGVVMRNSDGHVIAVGAYQGVFSDNVDIAEAEAFRFGVQLASEISCLRWWWSRIRCGLLSLSTANVIYVLSYFGLFHRYKC